MPSPFTFRPDPDRSGVSPPLREGGGRGLRSRSPSFLLLLVLLVSGCATKGDVADLTAELRRLNAQQEVLIRELRLDQVELGDSIHLLARNQGELRAEILRRMVDLQEDLLRVQEVVGVSQQQLSALRDQIETSRSSLAASERGDPTAGAGGEGQAADLYREAAREFRRGAFTAARFGFEEMIERFPNHDLIPDARFFLAEILVEEGEIEEAIEGFLRIREFHPNAERVPQAVYRVGLLYRDQGNRAEARRFLELVVNTWPDSEAAELAGEALRTLG